MRSLAVALLALSLTGCALDDELSLRREIGRIVPDGAEQQDECDFGSGFVENAPASLRCRFLVDGNVGDAAATVARNLRDTGLRAESKPGAGPSARLLYGLNEEYAVHLALIAERRYLFFQVRQSPVPVGMTGIDVTVSQRK
jgi:hypothetical protein